MLDKYPLKFKPSSKEMQQSGVYSITSDNKEVFYIGSAKNFANRLAGHKVDCKRGKGNRIITEFLVNSTWLDLSFNILEIVENEIDLKDRENYWIGYYGFENLSNLSPDAKSCIGVKMPEETKKKASERMKGNSLNKNRKFKPDKGIKTALYWETHPEEKQQMIERNRESQNKIDRSSWVKCKIIEVSLNGEKIDECFGKEEVVIKYSITKFVMNKLLTSEREPYNGYSLRYIGSYFKNDKIEKTVYYESKN